MDTIHIYCVCTHSCIPSGLLRWFTITCHFKEWRELNRDHVVAVSETKRERERERERGVSQYY